MEDTVTPYVDEVYVMHYDPIDERARGMLHLNFYAAVRRPEAEHGYGIEDEPFPLLTDQMPMRYAGITPDTLPVRKPIGQRRFVVVGATGLQPEQFEAEYGPRMGLFLLERLARVVQCEVTGTYKDEFNIPHQYRPARLAAVRFLERVHDVVVILHAKVQSTPPW